MAKRSDQCKAAAVLIHKYVDLNLRHEGVADAKICFALDVFNGSLINAPRDHKKLSDNLLTSCEEAALWWPNIEPPADYDGPDLS